MGIVNDIVRIIIFLSFVLYFSVLYLSYIYVCVI